MEAYLILEDGTTFTGRSIGSTKDVISEIVFNTSAGKCGAIFQYEIRFHFILLYCPFTKGLTKLIKCQDHLGCFN